MDYCVPFAQITSYTGDTNGLLGTFCSLTSKTQKTNFDDKMIFKTSQVQQMQ